MVTPFRVRVWANARPHPVLVADRTIAVSSPHYAAREVLFGARHALPRGWKEIQIQVTRP